MINDKVFKQEGGDNSTNLQGQTFIINNGISYEDAKGIALDVFKSNYLELSTKAADTAKQRAEELVEDFLQQVKERNPNAINTMEDPGMQYAIFSAQKEYARTGDKNMSDMLVDVLVDRAAFPERNLKQIVLDECLQIIPKLTTSQLDTLTIVFILRYTQNHGINNIHSFKNYLEQNIKPFVFTLSKEDSLYQHIEYAGCGAVGIGEIKIETVLSKTYRGLFFNGFTIEQLMSVIDDYNNYPTLFVPCLQNASKLQISAMNDDVLEQKLKGINVSEDKINKFKTLFDQYQMGTDEAKQFIVNQGDFMNVLFDIWDNSSMKHLTLTSVGIAIAIANLRRKTKASIDLGIWIK